MIQDFSSQCLASGRPQARIGKHLSLAHGDLVEATPTMFINGRRQVGALKSEQEETVVFRGVALEPTQPPHNDGAAPRVSERIESCFQYSTKTPNATPRGITEVT